MFVLTMYIVISNLMLYHQSSHALTAALAKSSTLWMSLRFAVEADPYGPLAMIVMAGDKL